MLTDAKARNAKAVAKPLKLTDGGGLYLHVTPAGSKIWRLRYETGGKEQTLTVGHYPEVGLAAARDARDAARDIRRQGGDPALARQTAEAAAAEVAANTFECLAREWHALHVPRWEPVHAEQVLGSLEDHIFPELGARPIETITPKMVLDALRVIEARPAVETAHRVRQRMSAVFVFAIASGRGSGDPAAIVKAAMAPVVRGRQPAVVDLDGVRKVLRDAEAIAAQPGTRLALRLLALTALRPGELRGARPEEFSGMDTASPLWLVPAPRMKMKREHLVPLSRQAVETVAAARSLTGRGMLLFPSVRHAHRPLSENALGYLLNRAGYHGQHVPHGFRAAFSTIMNELHPADRPVIDLMLAHAPKDRVEAAYNRARHLERRRQLAQEWADLLLDGFAPASDLTVLARR
jgi:integrase